MKISYKISIKEYYLPTMLEIVYNLEAHWMVDCGDAMNAMGEKYLI